MTVLLQPHRDYDLERMSHVAMALLDTRGVLPESARVVSL